MWWQSSASLVLGVVVLLVLVLVLGRGGKGVCGAVFFLEEEEEVNVGTRATSRRIFLSR